MSEAYFEPLQFQHYFTLACQVVDALKARRKDSGRWADELESAVILNALNDEKRLISPAQVSLIAGRLREIRGCYNMRDAVKKGVIDADRVSAEIDFDIMAWDHQQGLWIRVAEHCWRRGYTRDVQAQIITALLVQANVPHSVEESFDPNNPPFYRRELDSFSNEVITRCRQSSEGLWYACLDAGPQGRLNDPSFSACSKDREQAIRICADNIRANAAKPDGYQCLKPGYDLRFRFMQHWADKESQNDLAAVA